MVVEPDGGKALLGAIASKNKHKSETRNLLKNAEDLESERLGRRARARLCDNR